MKTLAGLLVSTLAVCATFPAQALTYQIGHRPEIGRVDAPKTIKTGEAARILIESKGEGGAGCGMIVSFGDGSEDKHFKMNQDGVKFPMAVEHVYKKAGKYTVKARGTLITTNKECKGSASATIQVGNPNPGKAKGQQK
ncbi:MAG TPA: hypothetical protein VL180_10625 [Burkholderiales bacterium]|nr:hypothetical protein [Burkholderiales bacterium]